MNTCIHVCISIFVVSEKSNVKIKALLRWASKKVDLDEIERLLFIF